MESVTCPGCQRPIRVPDDVLGRRARCPFCKCHFRAPVRTPEGLTAPQFLRRNPFADRRVLPATFLLVAGVMGLLTNGLQVAQAYLDPDAFREQTRDFFDRAAERSKTPELRDQVPVTLEWLPRFRAVCAGLSLVTTAGAVSMLRARRHGLAMLGSVFAMFNVTNCCCFGNILIGGWALYTLLNPAVRAQFAGPGGGSDTRHETPDAGP